MLPAKLDNPSAAPRTKMAEAENYCTSFSFPLALWHMVCAYLGAHVHKHT